MRVVDPALSEGDRRPHVSGFLLLLHKDAAVRLDHLRRSMLTGSL